MSSISSIEQYFPLQDIPGVLRLFKYQLEQHPEPDLALLSIVAGILESFLTSGRLISNSSRDNNFGDILPTVEYRVVHALYNKFHSIIKGYVDLSVFGNIKYASRELVKKVSDVIWNCLSRSYYKDRPHLQSLYSFLTGSRLDCFGVALAVVAGCQVLGFQDVHLALSEDHTWVMFGENSSETAEVTWHGKGNDDKRGQDISAGLASRCWLYLSGYPVVCDRNMEVAALVSSINNSMSTHIDSVELSNLQQELLWLLYDKGLLSRYPMAVGNLGDMEEIHPTSGRPLCSALFNEAVMISRLYYNNMHVYPYTYQGGFFYRHKMYKEAFESWANASDVLRQYNYTRDDEEIYREVMEIANELIPHVVRTVSSGHDAHSILKDPHCFAYLLRFYDGICQWEEGSQTPVLHIGWVKPLVNTISKFDADVRGKVIILEQSDSVENSDENSNVKSTAADAVVKIKKRSDIDSVEPINDKNHINDKRNKTSANHLDGIDLKKINNDNNNNNSSSNNNNNNNNNVFTDKKLRRKSVVVCIKNSTSEVKKEENCPEIVVPAGENNSNVFHPDIKALTAACSEKLLNRNFLIQGDGNPFLGASSGGPATSYGDGSSASSSSSNITKNDFGQINDDPIRAIDGKSYSDGRPKVMLYSEKMRGLKDLLLIEKLNTHAISLQLTAQSQVQIGGKRQVATSKDDDSTTATSGGGIVVSSSRPKRSRRE